MNRRDFYYRQKVTEGEMDDAFDQVEEAFEAQSAQNGLAGITSGAAPGQTAPPSWSVHVAAGTGQDKLGRHLPLEAADKPCDVDENGSSTAVAAGNQRWVSVFARSSQVLSDVRTDGNGTPVYYHRDEAVALRVVMGPEETLYPDPEVGTRPALDSEDVLVFDAKINEDTGANGILDGDISLTRREDWMRDEGGNSWGSAQEFIQQLISEYGGTAVRLAIAQDWHDGYGEILGNKTLSEFANLFIQQLALDTPGVAPLFHTGDDRIGACAKSSSPDSLLKGSIMTQLAALLAVANERMRKTTADTVSATHTFSNGLNSGGVVQLQGASGELRGQEPGGSGIPTVIPLLSGHPFATGGCRVWQTSTGQVFITFNCRWVGGGTAKWYATDETKDAIALAVGTSHVMFYRKDKDDAIAAGWMLSSWTSSFSWLHEMTGKGMVSCPWVTGDLYEQHLIHFRTVNTTGDGDAHRQQFGGALNWRSAWDTPPTTFTYSLTESEIATTVAVVGGSATYWGARLYGVANALLSGVAAYSFGTIEVED